ncbi:histone-lysine N-methyltransferase ASH1L [Trichonephila clavipes]|nr:histone-lysine N-methyltransferase ASH1L [Trichonephila clavipes]
MCFVSESKTDEDDEVIRCICNIYKDEGDCVYLRREEASQATNESVQGQILAQGLESGDAAARDSLRSKKAQLMDIFRVERLWKDEQNNKFAFGHHYLRPHETYHEPSRKFFANEV